MDTPEKFSLSGALRTPLDQPLVTLPDARKHYDSYLYVQYLHGAKPPWRWRLHSFATSWSQWVLRLGRENETDVGSKQRSTSAQKGPEFRIVPDCY